MDFSHVESYPDRILIKDVRNFELNHIFDCGQCFRWDRQPNGNYIGVAFGRVIEVEKSESDVILYNVTEQEFNSIWAEYFDLYRDYGQIKEILSEDPLLKEAVNFGSGIRILQQDSFELVISFIISANNRIPMIKREIKNICTRWGNPIDYKGVTYYSFPLVEELIEAKLKELEQCSVGFRAKYIKDTVEKIFNNKQVEGKYEENFDLGWISCQNADVCHTSLQSFSGIGPKVADCIMLFSMKKYSAFPVDVWVKRAMQSLYLAPDVSLKKIRDFAQDKFGELSGFAQQYLFYYAREKDLKI